MMGDDIFERLKKNKERAEGAANEEPSAHGGDVDVNGNITSDKDDVVLTAKEETRRVKRTYYIDPEQEQKITWASRKTGRDKSEIVRIALALFFDTIEIP